MGWNDAKDKADKYGTGLFLKLKDGDSFTGIFCGEPEPRETVWINNQTEDYDENNPEHKGINTSLKMRFNFFELASSSMKILEVNLTFFRDILHQKEKRGDLEGKVFEISRKGAGAKDTKYYLDFEGDATPEQLDAISKTDLHDLQPRKADDKEKPNPGDFKDDSNDKNHGAEFLDELKSRLKQVPREALTEFLKEFGISKIGDLDESKYAQADAFVSAAEAARDGDGVDPFGD
jgi:hypothetical protein